MKLRETLSLFLLLLGIFVLFSSISSSQEGFEGCPDKCEVCTRVLGDINRDGEVNSTDITIFDNLLNNRSGKGSYRGQDLNSDGKINVKDLQVLKRVLNGTLESFKRCPDFLTIGFDKEKYITEEYISGEMSIKDFFGRPICTRVKIRVFLNGTENQYNYVTVEGRNNQLGEIHREGDITYLARTPKDSLCPVLEDSASFRTVRKKVGLKITNITRNIVSVKNTGRQSMEVNVTGFERDVMLEDKIIKISPKETEFLSFDSNVTRAIANATRFEASHERSLITDIAEIDVRRLDEYTIKVQNKGEAQLIIVTRSYNNNELIGKERFILGPGESRALTYTEKVERSVAEALNTKGLVKDSITFPLEDKNDSNNNIKPSKTPKEKKENREGILDFFIESLISFFREIGLQNGGAS